MPNSLPGAAELCRHLVSIPSVNPDGEPGTDQTGERKCAEYVGELLKFLGAEVWFDEVLPDRPNVIGRFPTEGADKPSILLAPHTDTVSVAGMTIDPFAGEVRDGRIYGRGSSDTKGTMAAMLRALAEIGEGIPSLGCRVTFAGLMGEETGQWGSKDFAKRYHGFDLAIAGEPTDCRVVHTHKGSWWAELRTRGRAAHGARPELGENAILKMARVAGVLDTDFRSRLRAPEFRHPVLGDSTLNPGVVRGGSRTNIVPDECTLHLDVRFTPALSRYGVERLLQETLREFAAEIPVEVITRSMSAPLDTPADHPLVRKLAAAGAGLTGAPWFCDAAWLAQAGIPSVAAGPGSIDQAHTADEWIAIDDLEKGVAFFRRFLESFGEDTGR